MINLTELCSTGGCAAKYDGSLLNDLLGSFTHASSTNLLVGLDPPDDAAVLRLDQDSALVFTVDFFPPIVDDPLDYGRIAANNALNDIYAMGGRPTLALAIAAFPPDMDTELTADIIRGAAQQCSDAGVMLAGGHTIRDKEPKFGLAVVGMVHPDRIWRKSGARPGDVILITKPLGTGLLATGHRQGIVTKDTFRTAIEWMLVSSDAAARAITPLHPHAVTDVTGFGLLGHASEVADRSEVHLTIDMTRVPLLGGAHDCAQRGVRTSGHGPNMELVRETLSIGSTIPDCDLAVALDPQTAGGLMIVVDAESAGAHISALQLAGSFVAEVGRVDAGAGVSICRSQ